MVAPEPNYETATAHASSAFATPETHPTPDHLSQAPRSAAIPGVTVDVAQLMRFEHRQHKTARLPNKVSKQDRRGDFRSLFKGKGMAFAEVRQYQPGDDVRTIDWRVTARRGGQPHTKLFEEERERPVYIVVDQRQHLFFGTQRCFKSVLACEIGALMAWQALAVGDRISHLVFGDDQAHQHRPQAGKRGVLACLQALVLANQSLHLRHARRVATGVTVRSPHQHPPGSTLVNALESVTHLAKPGSYVVLISDFLGLADTAQRDSIQHALRQLAQHTHTYGVFLYDLLEAHLPPADYLAFTDGQRNYALNSRHTETHTQYHQQFLTHLRGTQQLFKSAGLPLLLRGTHQETDRSLLSVLHDPKWRQADTAQSEQHIANAAHRPLGAEKPTSKRPKGER